MIARTKKSLAHIVLIVLFSFACLGALIHWINKPPHPVIPEKSAPNKVILTSRGCCFWAENVIVYILDKNGNKVILIEEEKIYEYDIYKCEDIPGIEVPVQIGIDFTAYYPDAKEISLTVGTFSSTKEMLMRGLLLCFGDGDLIVRNGDDEKYFRAGVFRGDDNGPWYQERL